MASRAGLPLRDVIAAAIRGRIIDGSYVPGSRLREEEIASDFDVSRVPVREAFQVLEQQRFLELRKYKGAIVAQPESSGTRELIAIRAELEAMAARLAAAAHGGAMERELRSLTEEGSTLDPVTEPERHSELVERFHDTVAIASGNRELVEMLRTLRSRLSWIFGAELAARAAGSWDEHRDICASILGGEEAAAHLMREHVLGDLAFFDELIRR